MGHFKYRTFHRWDISQMGNFTDGHFTDGHFTDGTFHRWEISQMDISQMGHFTDGTFHRLNISQIGYFIYRTFDGTLYIWENS